MMANTQDITCTTGTCSSSGNNTILAAPSNAQLRHVILGFIIQNETSTANTMILGKGAITGSLSIARCLGQNQGDGLTIMFPPDKVVKLPVNTAVVLNLSSATSCGFTLWTYTE